MEMKEKKIKQQHPFSTKFNFNARFPSFVRNLFEFFPLKTKMYVHVLHLTMSFDKRICTYFACIKKMPNKREKHFTGNRFL